MNRKCEALNLAVTEMRKGVSTKKALRKALAAAQTADVTTTDYVRAHAMLSVAAGTCVIAELEDDEK